MIRIVLDGLRGETAIAELCWRQGVAASMYYSWSKEFLEAGKRRLAGDTTAVHTAVRAGIKRIHFIAPTTTDFHDVNVEGKSGIFATCGRDPRPRWVSSRRRLEWPNGAMCVFFSGEEPESLRGPQAEMVIVDEIARMRYQQSVFDTLMLGLRLGDRCWLIGPRPAARRSGARPWSAAMMTSTPTTLWSKSTSVATWRSKWSSRPLSACTNAASATQT
jgi:phage terminase large subunit-like protein